MKMTPEQFCFWLQGCLEMSTELNAEQINQIKNKLDTVFEHVAEKPSMKKSKPIWTEYPPPIWPPPKKPDKTEPESPLPDLLLRC